MIHILTQYVWPDCSPTAIYSEQLADGLLEHGHEVVLVGGRGSYREGVIRPAPRTKTIRLEHRAGLRGNLSATALEYTSLTYAIAQYVRGCVKVGDTVVAGSFPPLTVYLGWAARRRGARSVYWLQDYYPELARALWDGPAWLTSALKQSWNFGLRGWDHVIKAADNLGYYGSNAVTLRNWSLLELGEARPFEPGLAAYIGNLGYAHCVASFVVGAKLLRDQGYRIRVLGDGPGVRQLPSWIEVQSLPGSRDALRAAYWKAEVHLIAADPRIEHALFPSKFWCARATGRRIKCTGFDGAMARELTAAFAADHTHHRERMIEYVESVARSAVARKLYESRSAHVPMDGPNASRHPRHLDQVNHGGTQGGC
jgi:hypothetical protein